MKVGNAMYPHLPYHIVIPQLGHRIIYIVPHRSGEYEWRDWFTHYLYGIGPCRKAADGHS